MPEPSKRSQLIPFSPIRVMFRLADELERAGGGRVIRLHVGDPDFAPPEAAIEATLPPGSYTALVRDALTSAGVALIEVYDLNLP